ncbi:putative membrane protein DUF2306 [Chitinophaga skermanii]|uniref:Putative membrane protein DUF2306 n=1 Tax=Chitinophaga skermanii TaxID=331697 RepID=A0A327R2M3_9BACT|nr:DUF2306 domain-containing protein [Chitinophaga skermanii]RAJ10930.1 putative membrane protein DUF2306 [Chitinophaga skermanii]
MNSKIGGVLLRVAAMAAILWGTWLMILLSLPYTSFDPYIDFLNSKQLVYHIKTWRYSFYIHVFVSTIVLITGLLQFSKYIMFRKAQLHRGSGIVYIVIVIFLSGPSGLIMGIYANGGLAAQVSFVLLSLLWILFTGFAFYYATKRKFAIHGHWMLRSFALTLSAISLRFYAFLLATFHVHLHPRTAYILIAWLSWTLNLLLAEYLIRRKWIEKYYLGKLL